MVQERSRSYTQLRIEGHTKTPIRPLLNLLRPRLHCPKRSTTSNLCGGRLSLVCLWGSLGGFWSTKNFQVACACHVRLLILVNGAVVLRWTRLRDRLETLSLSASCSISYFCISASASRCTRALRFRCISTMPYLYRLREFMLTPLAGSAGSPSAHRCLGSWSRSTSSSSRYRVGRGSSRAST